MSKQKEKDILDQDFDRYGVWVKAGPEEVLETEEETFDPSSLGDLGDLDGFDEPSEAGDFDDLGDLSNLDDLASPFDEDDTFDADLSPVADRSVDGAPGDARRNNSGDEDDLISLDDLGIDAPPDDRDPFAGLGDDLDDLDDLNDLNDLDNLPDLDTLSDPDLSPDPLHQDDLEADGRSSSEDSPDQLPEMELELDDDIFGGTEFDRDHGGGDGEDTDTLDTFEESLDSGEETGEEEDFDLDSITESLDDDYETLEIDESLGIDAGEGGESGDGSFDQMMPGADDEIEELSLEDIDLYEPGPGDLDLPELDQDLSDQELPGQEVHDFTPEEQGIEISPHGPPNTITPDEEDFLREEEEPHQDSLPGNLQNPPGSAIPTSMDQQEQDAFQRIQDELSAIKQELAELKSVLRETSAAARAPGAPVHSEVSPAPNEPLAPEDDVIGEEPPPSTEDRGEFPQDQKGSGFFEEGDEEDETIALTGDELDNILNTAEFTEEAGEAEELDEDFLTDHHAEPGIDSGPSPAPELSPGPEPEDQAGSVDGIELEESREAPFVIDGDDRAIDELAEMNIDEELADIDSLTDDTEEDAQDQIDRIELNLDSLEEFEDDSADLPDEEAPGDGTSSPELPEDSREESLEDFLEGDLSDDLATGGEFSHEDSPLDEAESPLEEESEELAVEADLDAEEGDAAEILDTGAGADAGTDLEDDIFQTRDELAIGDEAIEIDPAFGEESSDSPDDGSQDFTLDDDLILDEEFEIEIDEEDPDFSAPTSTMDTGPDAPEDPFDLDEPEQEHAGEPEAEQDQDGTPDEPSLTTIPEDLGVPEDLDVPEEEIAQDHIEGDDLLDDFTDLSDLEIGDDELALPPEEEPRQQAPDLQADREQDEAEAGEEPEEAGGATDDLSFSEENYEDFASAVEQDLSGDTGHSEGQDLPAASPSFDPLPESPVTEVPPTAEEGAPEEPAPAAAQPGRRSSIADLPEDLKQEMRSVLSYMDQLLEALPDDKIEEFAQSEHFEVYKHLFEELGIET